MVDNRIMKERLNRAFTESKVDNVELAEFCDVTEQAVSKWRRTGGISKHNISKVTRFFQKPENWLTAEKEPVGTPDYLVPIPYYRPSNSQQQPSTIAEDQSRLYAENDNSNKQRLLSVNQSWISQRNLDATHLFLISIDDDSMAPIIQNGDIVVINTKDKAINSGKIYALDYANNDLKVKMLKLNHKGDLIIHSVNKIHGDELVLQKDIDSLIILGRAIWLCSEL